MSLDLAPEEFERYGAQVVQWIANYLRDAEQYPVLAQVEPGAIKQQLPSSPPAEPESMTHILEDFERVIMPGITHWNHPSFFAYFAISGSAPGILGEMLSAALNVNGMLWKTSPAVTELEEVTLDWLRQMIRMPPEFRGMIVDTASVATMTAIAAARESLDLDIRRQGMAGRSDLPRLRLYVSEQAHSSVEKGSLTLGIGQENVRKIAVDDQFRMDVAVLRQAIVEDQQAGYRPFCVVATVGTTSTTSIDPVPEIAALCREHGLWLHVDSAYGGVAAMLPEMRHILDGCAEADSLVVNPHKWLFTPVDCSVLYMRNPDILKRAFSLVPEYLVTGEDEVTNFMDWGVQLGRRFRALKLWMVIRTYGQNGLAARIRNHIEWAQQFAQWIDEAPQWERLAPTPFSTVCFRACPSGMDEAQLNQLNAHLLERVNATGAIFISHTKLHDRYTLRLAIGNIRTEPRHIAQAWQLLQSQLQTLL